MLFLILQTQTNMITLKKILQRKSEEFQNKVKEFISLLLKTFPNYSNIFYF